MVESVATRAVVVDATHSGGIDMWGNVISANRTSNWNLKFFAVVGSLPHKACAWWPHTEPCQIAWSTWNLAADPPKQCLGKLIGFLYMFLRRSWPGQKSIKMLCLHCMA